MNFLCPAGWHVLLGKWLHFEALPGALAVPETWIDGWKRSERWGGTTSQCCRFGQKISYPAPSNLMLHHHSSMYLRPGCKDVAEVFFSIVYGLKLPNPSLPRVLLLITERSKEAKGASVSKCIFPCDFSGVTTDFNMARNQEVWLRLLVSEMG